MVLCALVATDSILQEKEIDLQVTAVAVTLFMIWLALRTQRTRLAWSRFPTELRSGHGFAEPAKWRQIQLPPNFSIERDGRRLYVQAQGAKNPVPGTELVFLTSGRAELQQFLLMNLLAAEEPEQLRGVHLDPRPRRSIRQGFAQSPATMVLIAANIFFSCAVWVKGDRALMAGALRVSEVSAGQYYRLLTSMFLHVNLLHLTMNMLALSSLGQQVEKLLGSKRMLFIYFASGLCAGTWGLYWIHERWLVGASGAVFGLFGAIASYIYLGKKDLPDGVYLPTSRQLSTDLMINAGLSLLPFVSFSAHFGGFVGGFVLTHFVRPRKSRK
jgi:membrane associated rhomboid family serine protease